MVDFSGSAASVPFFLAHAKQQSPRIGIRENGIPFRTLGRTGEKVSLIGLGGYHLGKQADPQESIRIIRTGSRFRKSISWTTVGTTTAARVKSAWETGLRDGYRQKAFLMSKIDGRTKAAATAF